MSATETSLFPEVFGTEEETRISLLVHGVNAWRQLDSIDIKTLLDCVESFCGHLSESQEFLRNGSRIYYDAVGIELATAESDSPLSVTAGIRANASLLTDSLGLFVKNFAKSSGLPQTASWQRRVIDSEFNTWGCHDNSSFEQYSFSKAIANQDSRVARVVSTFATTRPFITGAGLVSKDQLLYSQKLSQLHQYNEYGFSNSLFRVDSTHNRRFEVRCNDINILDWATIARVGGTALVQAAVQTPLVRKLEAQTVGFELNNPAANVMHFTPDLELRAGQAVVQAVKFQRELFETILGEFRQPMPQIYAEIGASIIDYCDDFLTVVNGDADLASLADRADWAAKIAFIRESVRRDIERKKQRHLTDPKSRGTDMMYDDIRVSSDGEEIVTTRGYGYKNAARHRIVDTGR